MIRNTKTRIDEIIAEAISFFVLVICSGIVCSDHAIDFSICYYRKFLWPYPGRKYDISSVHAMGGYMVSFGLYPRKKNL